MPDSIWRMSGQLRGATRTRVRGEEWGAGQTVVEWVSRQAHPIRGAARARPVSGVLDRAESGEAGAAVVAIAAVVADRGRACQVDRPTGAGNVGDAVRHREGDPH